MNGKVKKPPVNLDELENKEPKAEKGPIGYTGDKKEGKGVSGIAQILVAALIAVVLSALLVITYSPRKADLVAIGEKLDTVVTEVGTARGEVGFERSRIDNLINSSANYATKGDITALQNLPSEIDAEFATLEEAYEARIAALEAILQELELITEEGEVITTEDTTLWSKDIYCTSHSEEAISIDYRFSPSKVEDEEDYAINLYLSNLTENPITNCIIEIVLTPRRGDRVKVDEDELYLDTTKAPFYLWDTEVIERNDGTCRRIVSTSEKIKVPAGTVDTVGEDEIFKPGELTLKLEFTLVYK